MRSLIALKVKPTVKCDRDTLTVTDEGLHVVQHPGRKEHELAGVESNRTHMMSKRRA
jgi:hypothetical protein